MPGRGKYKDVANWPLPDRELWLRGLAPASRLKETGHAVQWRPGTVSKTARAYATWLMWLNETGQFKEGEQPSERLTNERVDAYRKHLESNVKSLVTVRSLLHGIERTMSVIAPRNACQHLKRCANSYPKKRDPLKKRARLQNPVVLRQLGLDLMDSADEKLVPTRRDAVIYRDGLMIALLACRAMRLRNLTSIDTDKHFGKTRTETLLEFPASEVKNHKKWTNSWPELLLPRLARYLSLYRPLLLKDREDTGRLWISERICPLTDSGIYYAITTRTRNAFGLSLNPHLFRDAAITSLAVHNPELVGLGCHVLGNSLATSQTHYNQAACIEASVNLNDAMERRRRRSGRA